ncbi:MAG TPA: transketolase C-terminal domain-containing protein [Anaerolineaceae bacterium]|jgi:transketolase|nr:transketolase C-terminal domain-containing protein [Anaerolineaceae bacterium]HOH20606.1 transketolase C-terminal domain-containing protein [Anaerolineaceae bacterium]HPA34055.1 transketolase C-terminal domain-containing protein [Anaerolineaceae bacterium]HQO97835.1 transketolase C-terminal domain-containing protein [Anaerolineaceae bacterium]HQP61408.1 transketolase C-terminal domain-containing protein [Anaerolineaceae bacterium]
MAQELSQRVVFGETLVELASQDSRVVCLDGDLATSTRTDMLFKAHPDRFFMMGIAEQNMFGVAAGMASVGLIPFVSTFACFTAKRALDQIRIVIAQPGLNVKFIGAYSGILTGKTGKTHQSVEDLTVFRAMPNVVSIAPIDGVEVRQAMHAMVEYDGPVYLRLTRDPMPVIMGDSYQFQIGKAVTLWEGKDITLIGTGEQTQRCLDAANLLAADGISAFVLHVPTLKPLDVEAIVNAAAATGLVVTAEDHSILGGLGGAVAEVLGEEYPVPMKRIGLRDTFGESASNAPLLEKYGLTARHVAAAAKTLLEKRST